MTETCTNVQWAAENGESVEWARGMWWCDCSACTPEPPAPLIVGDGRLGSPTYQPHSARMKP